MKREWNDRVRDHFLDYMVQGISQCRKIGELLSNYSVNSRYPISVVKKQWGRLRQECPHVIEIAVLNGKKYKQEKQEYEQRLRELKRQQEMTKPLTRSACGVAPRKQVNNVRGRRIRVDSNGVVELC